MTKTASAMASFEIHRTIGAASDTCRGRFFTGTWRAKMSKTALSILGSLLLSTALSAPATAGSAQHSRGKHPGLPHYVLFDVGTFGGEFSNFFGPATRQLNRRGEAVGADNT